MSIFSLLSSVLLSLVWPITVLDNQRFIWFALLVFFFYERTSSFISWSLSSRPLASSFALRCCDSVEDLAFFSSEVSCLLFESSRRNERLSTSAEWRRWVKPRMWLWRALTVCCRQERKKEMTHHHTPRHHTHTITQQRPHYAGDIWTRSLISTVSPTVHTKPIPSRKWGFSKKLFKQEEFENANFWFSCGWESFWKRSFSKSMASW